MKNQNQLFVDGIPAGVKEADAAVCRSRLLKAAEDLMRAGSLTDVQLSVGTQPTGGPPSPSLGRGEGASDELTVEQRALQYRALPPVYNFDFLVAPHDLHEELVTAVELVNLEKKVFDEWNLRSIEPYPRTALNFYGPPGTGKTIAAHAIADYLRRPILVASYAQIESKYHGDGPKNVEAIFYAAERDGAVLFIDEADSLLSKRLTSVTQGSEQAINSMRSQLLICLGQFRGVVIFATNLIVNYDKAFETRVRNLHFPMPDAACRLEIWRRHLPAELPLAADVNLEELAQVDDLCGRDIKNTVINAALKAARYGTNSVDKALLFAEVERVKASRIKEEGEDLAGREKEQLSIKIAEHLEAKEGTNGVSTSSDSPSGDNHSGVLK